MNIKQKLYTLVISTVLLVVALSISFLVHEKNQLNAEREIQLKIVVDTIYTQFEGLNKKVVAGEITLLEAQSRAKDAVRGIRYSEDEYVWINDLHPKMIMHPFKTSLDGDDLSNFKDTNGKFLFIEFVKTVRMYKDGGTVDYMWPKPGQDKPVPKVSFVKLYEPWGWVIGTGVYIDDLNSEYATIVKGVLLASFILCLLTMIMSIYISRSILADVGCDPGEANTIVGNIADGNLTVTFDQQPVGMMDSVSKMQNQLKDIVVTVKYCGRNASNLSNDLIGISRKLSNHVEKQNLYVHNMDTTVTHVGVVNAEAEKNVETVRLNSIGLCQLSISGTSLVETLVDDISKTSSSVYKIRELVSDFGTTANTAADNINIIKEIVGKMNLLMLKVNVLSLNKNAVDVSENKEKLDEVTKEMWELSEKITRTTDNVSFMVSTIKNDATSLVSAIGVCSNNIDSESVSINLVVDAINEIKRKSHIIVESVKTIDGVLSTQRSSIDSVTLELQSVLDISKRSVSEVKNVVIAAETLNEQAEILTGRIEQFKI